MKKLFVLLVMVMGLFVLQGFAQTTVPEKIVVNIEDLTASQLEKIKESERIRTMDEKLKTYGKWVGSGKEIGITVEEALNAVVDVAEKFGNTRVGEFTLVMVAWKVMGKDVIRIFIGIVFMIISTVVCTRALRTYFSRRILVEGASWLVFWKTRKYEMTHVDNDEGSAFMKVVWVVLLMGSYGITYAIMFS